MPTATASKKLYKVILYEYIFKKGTERKRTRVSTDGHSKNGIDYILTNDNNVITDVDTVNCIYTGGYRLFRAQICIKW